MESQDHPTFSPEIFVIPLTLAVLLVTLAAILLLAVRALLPLELGGWLLPVFAVLSTGLTGAGVGVGRRINRL